MPAQAGGRSAPKQRARRRAGWWRTAPRGRPARRGSTRPGKSWSTAWMISWQAPLQGREVPATDIAMPESTSASASTTRNSSSSIASGRRSTASPAVRAKRHRQPVDRLAAARGAASTQSSIGGQVADHVADAGALTRCGGPPGRSRGRRRPRAAWPPRRTPCRAGAPGRRPASRCRRGPGWWPPPPSAAPPGWRRTWRRRGSGRRRCRRPRRSRAAPSAACRRAGGVEAARRSPRRRRRRAAAADRAPRSRAPWRGPDRDQRPGPSRRRPLVQQRRRGPATAPRRMSTNSGARQHPG